MKINPSTQMKNHPRTISRAAAALCLSTLCSHALAVPSSPRGNWKVYVNPFYQAASTVVVNVATQTLISTQPDPATTYMAEGTQTEITEGLGNAAHVAIEIGAEAMRTATQPYVPNYAGAQRDTIAFLTAGAKTVIDTAIARQANFQVTETGQYVLDATTVGVSSVVEAARFYYQEQGKAILTNKYGLSDSNAAWAAYAISQAAGIAISVPLSYAFNWGLAPYFKKEQDDRLAAIGEAQGQQGAVRRLTESLKESRRAWRQNPSNIWLQLRLTLANRAYARGIIDLDNDLARLETFDDSPFGSSIEATQGMSKLSPIIDSYPLRVQTPPALDIKPFFAETAAMWSQCSARDWGFPRTRVQCSNFDGKRNDIIVLVHRVGQHTVIETWVNDQWGVTLHHDRQSFDSYSTPQNVLLSWGIQ